MAAKKDQEAGLKELKDKLVQEKVIIGSDIVMKELKKGNLNKIFLASNCRDDIKKEITHFANIQKVPVELLELSNEDLGVLCKKNFFVAVLGIQ